MDIQATLATHSPETREFWSALANNKFLLRGCRSCGQAHWYPRAICPFCASPETEWREASGRGVVYSYSIMRRAKQPYAIAFVTLAEGPTMMTNIVDCDFDGIHIGQEVQVKIQPNHDGMPSPMFTPA